VEEAEKETHYTDGRGRCRKRKMTRTRVQGGSSSVSAKGYRQWSPTEKQIVVTTFEKVNRGNVGAPLLAASVRALVAKHPKLFSKTAGGPSDISRAQVKTIVEAHFAGEKSDGRGRPPALPKWLQTLVLVGLSAVVGSRATLFSAHLLQPVAMGIIIANGAGSLLNASRREEVCEGKRRRGLFCGGVGWLRALLHSEGWKSVKPQGDTRKLPSDWASLRRNLLLRLAYMVFTHMVPPQLVINPDHTGIMFTQHKGSMWISPERVEAKDKSVKGHGDKRQFTCLAATAADGTMLPHQVVMQGSTSRCLPQWVPPNGEAHYFRSSLAAQNSKGHLTVCFVLCCATSLMETVGSIASFCCTANHWSDNVTSKAYIKDVADPYFRKTVDRLHKEDPSKCQEYGKQICVVLVDCWWGWLDADFRVFVRNKFPYIRLLYVPAACTPVAQPMDAGIIAQIKGFLRRLYGRWACSLTVDQLTSGSKPTEIAIPSDVPTLKKKLVEWLSASVVEANMDTSRAHKCWQATTLLSAWDRTVQNEARSKATELFPNIEDVQILIDDPDAPVPVDSDPDAGYLGKPFVEDDDEEAYERLVEEMADLFEH
jgi:hypothetical protein